MQTDGGKAHPRKKQESNLLPTNTKEDNHTKTISPVTTKIKESNNHYSLNIS